MKNEIDRWIETQKDAMMAELTELVRYRSVSRYDAENQADPFGEECSAVLEKALELAEGHGFSVKNYNNFCGTARLDVNDDPKEFGLFAHLDVVPELEGWFGEPYEVLYRDGWAIARGICDNKGSAIASIYALKYLREHGNLKHNWLIFFGLNEESGMKDIKHFLDNHPAPALSIVPDAGFPVCYAEKSHVNARIKIDISRTNILDMLSGTVINIVPGDAEAYISVKDRFEKDPADIKNLPSIRVSAKGLSAHASMPDQGVNAIAKLAEEVLAQGLLNTEGQKVMELVKTLAADSHGEFVGVDRDDPDLGDTSHVCSIARVEGRSLLLSFDIRFPATTKAQEIIDQLQAFYSKQGIEVEILRKDDAIPKDPHAPLIDQLTRIVNEELGTDLQPYTMGGGTYARKLPNAYGFGLDSTTPLPEFFPPGHGSVHQPNEAIFVEEYFQAVKILIKALLWLDANED